MPFPEKEGNAQAFFFIHDIFFFSSTHLNALLCLLGVSLYPFSGLSFGHKKEKPFFVTQSTRLTFS